MSVLSLKKCFLPVVAISAALALSACSSNGVNNNAGFNQFNNGFNQVKKVKQPATRYGGQYIVENKDCCQPVACCQPVQRPVIIRDNIVEVPAPTPAPIIEYVYEQPRPAPAPVYTPPPAPVYVPEPAPVYTPPPAPTYVPEPTPAPLYEPAPVYTPPTYTPPPTPSCPDGQIPAYGGQGCIPIVPLRK